MSRLIRSQLTKCEHPIHICERCLHYFYNHCELVKHREECRKVNDCAIKLPEAMKNKLKFKNYKHSVRHPFVIYNDFETMLKPVQDGRVIQKH